MVNYFKNAESFWFIGQTSSGHMELSGSTFRLDSCNWSMLVTPSESTLTTSTFFPWMTLSKHSATNYFLEHLFKPHSPNDGGHDVACLTPSGLSNDSLFLCQEPKDDLAPAFFPRWFFRRRALLQVIRPQVLVNLPHGYSIGSWNCEDCAFFLTSEF